MHENAESALSERLRAHVRADEPPMELTGADVLRRGRRARRHRRIVTGIVGAAGAAALVIGGVTVAQLREGDPGTGQLVMSRPTTDHARKATRLGGEVGRRLDAAVREVLPDDEQLELTNVLPTNWRNLRSAPGESPGNATEWRLTYALPGGQRLQIVVAYDYVWHLDNQGCRTDTSGPCSVKLYDQPESNASDSFGGREDNPAVAGPGKTFEAERFVGYTSARRADDIVVRAWTTLKVRASSLEEARERWKFSRSELTALVQDQRLIPPEPKAWPKPLPKPTWWPN